MKTKKILSITLLLALFMLPSVYSIEPVLVSIPAKGEDINNFQLSHKVSYENGIAELALEGINDDNRKIEVFIPEAYELIINKHLKYQEEQKISNKTYKKYELSLNESKKFAIIIKIKPNKADNVILRYKISKEYTKTEIVPVIYEESMNILVAEDNFTNFGIESGKPVIWVKRLQLSNPYDEEIEDIIYTQAFDCTSAYVMDDTEKEKKVVQSSKIAWQERLRPKEIKYKVIECITPAPNVELNAQHIILDGTYRIMYEYAAYNPSNADYKDVNIVTDYNAKQIRFIVGADIVNTNTIKIDNITAGATKTAKVIVEEPAPYLKTIVKNENRQLEVKYLVEADNSYNIETEIIDSDKNNMFSDIIEKVNYTTIINVSTQKWEDGRYKIISRLRKGFITIIEKEHEVVVLNGLKTNVSLLLILFLAYISLNNKRKLFK